MSGHEPAAHLYERRADTQIIVVSGYSSNEHFTDRRTVFLAQPVSLALLNRRLVEMLADVKTAWDFKS
jgi:hypothetical protein